MADSLVPVPLPQVQGDNSDDRAEQAAKRLIALLGRLSAAWTSIDTAQADRLEGVALYLLCGAGMVELRFTGRAWADESALDFEATACGVWIDSEHKSILPEVLRRAVLAWAKSAVAVQLNPVLEGRLTSHGEQTKRDLLSDGAELFLEYVCATPVRGRVSVQNVGNQGPAPGAVKRDDVSGEILAALESIAASQKLIAAATQGGAVAEQPADPTADLLHDVTLAAKVVVGGKRTVGLSRLIDIAELKEPAGRRLNMMEKTGLLRADESARELADLLKVTPAAVKKTRVEDTHGATAERESRIRRAVSEATPARPARATPVGKSYW
jgi:hypothetical protein